MNEEKIIEDAEALLEPMVRQAQYDMMRHGITDTAEKLQDPRAMEMLARGALAKAVVMNTPAAKPKGPQRRKASKVSARKRQRQARKANR